jgi:mono/diheme cytochrome c family protein
MAALAYSLSLRAEPAETKATASKPALVWDAMEKRTDLPAMTNLAYFTFSFTNTSPAETTILSTESSCDCTVAEASSKLPWHLNPGEGGTFKIRMNTLGKFGLVTKTVTVHTTEATQLLTINVKIPITPAPFNFSVRKQDVMAAQADRQAVFKGNCAACHSLPAAHLSGSILFEKACGICHVSEHRAEMVPDLSKLKFETTLDYWRTNIMHGKVGSLMPAFAKSEGGMLETNQIESLVEYLQEEFRGEKPGTTKQP